MDNLLSWNTALAEFNNYTELFIWLKMKQGDKPSPLLAELKAIERLSEIRHIHREQGIEKSDKYYKYLKFALQENIEQGLEVEKQHYEEIFLN